MSRLRPWSSALLSFGLLLTGQSGLPVAGATPEPGPGQTPTPAPPSAAVRPQNWGSCSQFLTDTSDVPTAQCTTVSVPVDYNNPGGAQAKLAVIRVPATGRRMGSLLVNPGGPGASAVDMVAGMASDLEDTDIRRNFDLVGFDPRGVGHSTPALRCRTDAEFDAYRKEPMVDYSPAGVAHIEQLYRQLAQQCVDRMGTGFLANVGTASGVRDMDMVRQALGEDQINYLGYSYGTELGTAYLEGFGDHVRTMVLDGAIDPAVGPVEENVNQMAGFQTAFNDYAKDCARSAACPLGTDPTQFVDRYHALINPLVAKPGRTSDPRGLSYADATTGTINALYTPQHWKYLTSGLLGLQRGTDAGDLLMLADDYEDRDKNGHYDNDQDAFNAVAMAPDLQEVKRCFREALEVSGVDASEIAYLNAHGPGTAQCDASEAQIMDEMFPEAKGIFSVKPLVGHCQAAASAVEVLASVYAYRTGFVPATPKVAPGHPRLLDAQ